MNESPRKLWRYYKKEISVINFTQKKIKNRNTKKISQWDIF